MSTVKRKASKRPKRARKRRVQEPLDWVAFLRPVVEEIPVAIEILERLRWAASLQKRGVKVARGRFGERRYYESRCPWQPSTVIPSRTIRTLSELKTAEEMASTIEREQLCRLLAAWELEVKTWGRAIIRTMGETLRLRQERAELLEAVQQTTAFFPDMRESEAARVHDELLSNPERTVETKHGSLSRAIVMCDEFGNELYEGPDEELLAEISRQPRDERVLRRILKGDQKKRVGGVFDIDRCLLRTDVDGPDKRSHLTVLDLVPPKKAE